MIYFHLYTLVYKYILNCKGQDVCIMSFYCSMFWIFEVPRLSSEDLNHPTPFIFAPEYAPLYTLKKFLISGKSNSFSDVL